MAWLVTQMDGDKSAVYFEPVSGDPDAPFHDPGQHLDKVLFHTDYDFYRVHAGPTGVTVTLPAVAGLTRDFDAAPPLQFLGQFVSADVLLLTHGLGYAPNYQIIWNGAELLSGDLVQSVGTGGTWRVRYLSHWADETGIYLTSRGASTAASLPAMDFSCQVVVFKPGVPSDDTAIDFDSVTGRLVLSGGMFDSDQVLLRAQGQTGDSPFDIIRGPSMGLGNGRMRIDRGNGSVVDEPGYNGSFVAQTAFQGVIA